MRALTRPLATLATLAAVTVLAGCSGDSDDTDSATDPASGTPTSAAPSREAVGPTCDYPSDGQQPAKQVDPPPSEAVVQGDLPGTISTSIGDLDITLDAATTPCTVNSFVSLADQGYFDGTTCHRLTTQGIFVLQCGDPSATGAGGPGYSFADELSGKETYGPGTLAMANAGPDTNGSQFFIVYQDTPLPASYTVFGTVDEAGVKLVADAAAAGTDEANGPGDGTPTTAVDIESVTVE